MALAASARVRASFEPARDPNVIPFIDVLLVLLIIFMVTAPKPTTDLRVDLSQRGPSIAQAIDPTIVDIHRAGDGVRFSISGQDVPVAELAQRALANMLAADPAITREDALAEGRIFVRADLDVAYQPVVTTVETLQGAQFRKVSIYAQDADPP
jgi:biopolymer transport protein ExbD